MISVSLFEDYIEDYIDDDDDTAETVAGTTCNDEGDFVLAFVPEGTYDILIETDGYSDVLIEDVAVTIGDTSTLDAVTLELTPEMPID